MTGRYQGRGVKIAQTIRLMNHAIARVCEGHGIPYNYTKMNYQTKRGEN
jgi:hypothetical protein